MSELVITVRDLPAPQGSKRGFANKATGRVSMVESSKRVKPWREAVRHAAEQARIDEGALVLGRDDVLPPLDGPVSVRVTFTLPRPAGHYRSGRNAHLLRENAPAWPHRKPDVDKLLRSTLDALGSAGVYTDDARVVDVHVRKAYPGTGLDALEVPGAIIRVRAIVAVTTEPVNA